VAFHQPVHGGYLRVHGRGSPYQNPNSVKIMDIIMY